MADHPIRKYVVLVRRLWGKHIAGPIAAVLAIILPIIGIVFKSSATITIWLGLAPLLLAVILIWPAQYQVWKLGQESKVNNLSPEHLLGVSLVMLAGEAEFFLKKYRDLNTYFPKETRTPLNPDNWPAFNPPTTWSYVQIQMCCLSSRFDKFLRLSRILFEEFGWKDEYVDLFATFDNAKPKVITMANLLAALQDFRNLLQSKFSALEEQK